MVDNFYKITSADELNKIFESAGDKLVILMFFTKHNGECRRALSAFEKSALNHTTSFFCVIDTDKFQGESRFVSNLNNMPKFECFYMGNSLGSYPTSNDKEIEQIVRSGEQYVMTQNNMKNSGMGQNNMMNQMGMMGMQQTQMNPMQIQQNVLNQAQMTNPVYFQYLMQNPMALQQLVQRQMMMQQQQQMIQPQMPMTSMTPMVSQMPMTTTPNVMGNMVAPVVPTVPQNTTPNQTLSSAMNTMSMPQQNNIIPTFQQMQQMFQIFQMMQQMGALNTNATPINNTASSSDTNQTTETNKQADVDNTIVLPNGDKLIPLPGGKFGLVKKSG
ncbi:hypothetical protein QJ857_gp0616 [Tupanvirus soda lake]|uniref:Thioredoxin domain-containing protein n=2 Tax=Tupanvirus TaxID=2094720 RepID=A0A6N1NSH0_9VIRU|nr:hypothetical protein QJ857_gp0616 [Tupanvirus soda lake]QKU35427.1 hypothetical protein [Tupanvirus soda lake]